ncbi:hypothetical protein E4U40_005078 [Claviceps sp. LM458 group G5]|nr:hypothetical protein E4U40_005078 [Claviceps sp. LM458 group G5]
MSCSAKRSSGNGMRRFRKGDEVCFVDIGSPTERFKGGGCIDDRTDGRKNVRGGGGLA